MVRMGTDGWRNGGSGSGGGGVARTGMARLQVRIEIDASTRMQKAEPAKLRPPCGCQRQGRKRHGREAWQDFGHALGGLMRV